MARRRKHHRSSHRRRVSGIGGDSAQKILGGVIGYVAGNTLGNSLTSTSTTTPTTGFSLSSPTVIGAALLAVPLIFGKKLKGSLMEGAGIGLAIAGTKQLGKAFGISMLSGAPVVAGYRRVRGLPAVSGSADQPYLRTDATRQQVVSGISRGEQVYAGAMMNDYNDGSRG